MSSPPIAITGMHRSGTSMVTRGLHDAGLVLLGEDDRLIDAADDNPEGFWENKKIVACNDDLLEAAGGSWDNPPDLLPQAVDDPRLTAIAERSIEALAGLRQHDHWGFKDPRTCLTAGYWLDLEPDLRFILCVRHPLEVALSLRRRNQNSYSLGLLLWERYYEAALATVPADHRLVTHYDTWFLDAEGELARLCEFAGLERTTMSVRTDLRHHTIGVSLTDAGVSDGLIELYQRLCAEAGNPQPPPRPADEGRVRRLILDGTVASRHAEQRQEAIDRLEEREAETRAEMEDLRDQSRAAETALRDRVRSLEVELAATRRTAITSASLQGELAGFATREQLDAALGQIAGRVEVAVANTRPSPLARLWRRLTGVAYRGGRRYLFRPTRVAAQRGRRTALPRAKSAARRLPPGAQTTLRRGRRLAHRTRRRLTGAPPPVDTAPVDEPLDDSWVEGFSALLSATADTAPTLVLDIDQLAPADAARFPEHATDELGAIAELEARRAAGARFLAITDGSRRWLHDRPALRDHVLSRHPVVADEPGAGLIVDLGARQHEDSVTLRSVIDRLTRHVDGTAAVLDWTELDLAPTLGSLTVFTPPEGDRLPYADDSVDIVVIERTGDRNEAARVSTMAVVVVETDDTGTVEVHTIESQRELTGPTAPRVVVVGHHCDDDIWRHHLAEAAADADAHVHFTPISAVGLGELPEADVVVLVEPGLVPLPGAIGAAAGAVAANPDGVVTGKVVTGDARLESAGAVVFSNRSVGLIGAGDPELVAPWHDYRRPTCWAPGLLAVPASLWSSTARPAHVEGRDFLREWCAQVWADGNEVVYHPEVVAVRLHGDGGEPSAPLSQTAWQRVLDLRPDRPGSLAEGAWRWVLAHDDVDACRG